MKGKITIAKIYPIIEHSISWSLLKASRRHIVAPQLLKQ